MRSAALPTRRVHTGDRKLDEIQRSAQDLTRSVNAAPMSGAVLIHAEVGKPDRTGLVFAAGTARSIKHGLGRPAIGFLEVYSADVTSAALVGLFASTAPAGVSSDTHVTVTPTASGTCFLVVF